MLNLLRGGELTMTTQRGRQSARTDAEMGAARSMPMRRALVFATCICIAPTLPTLSTARSTVQHNGAGERRIRGMPSCSPSSYK